MSYKLLGGGSDLNTVVSDMNQNILELKNDEVTKIFKNDQGNPVVILDKNGLQSKDDNGIVVSVLDKNGLRTTTPGGGVSALTANSSQLTFDSRRSTFQIVTTLTASFSVTSGASTQGSTTITINHNLGYIPLTENSVNVTTSNWNGRTGVFPIPYLVPGSNSASGAFIIASYIRVSSVTTSQITYDAGIIAGSFTLAGTITCYVKQQTAV